MDNCKQRRTVYFWMLVLAFVCSAVNSGMAENQVSACFTQKEKTLRMSCPDGQMVRVTRILEGFSEHGRCYYTDGDCVYEQKHTVIPCIGKQQCDLNLPSGNTGAVIHMCGTHGTYLQVEYSCVAAVRSTDICETKELTKQSGYIKTPRYPINYPDNRNCTLTIELPYKRQRLRLYVIDLMLESSNEGCYDLLYLYDGFRGYTTCGPDARNELMVTQTNHLQLTFKSNSQNREKGFWLYYEAYPHINETENKTVDGSGMVPSGKVPSTKLTESSTTEITTPQQLESTSEERVPIGLLVGAFLTVLGCVIITLVAVLFIRRRRQRTSNSCEKSSTGSKCTTTTAMNNKEYQQDGANNHNIRTINNIYNVTDGFNKVDNTSAIKQPFIDVCLETGDEKLIC